ncbi:MAG: flagellar biosynthetic protein FliO [Spirochaetales bacterium]|nr:flagellar biosynthetic protein FliO [Spirochaetales bacterium]
MDQCLRLCRVAVLCLVAVAAVSAQTPAAESTRETVATPATAVDETTLTLVEADEVGAADGAASSSIVPYFLRMVLVLGLVIAAIYGLYALLRKNARPAPATDAYLRVLATTSVGAGRSLHVVSVGDHAWLIGSTESSITPIAELQDKELIDALALRAAEAPEAPRRDFSSILIDMLGRKGSRTATAADTSDFFRRQRDRLKKY